MGALGGGVKINAAVHFDAVLQSFLPPPLAGLLDFRQRLGDERLPAKAGIDGHDQQHVELLEVRFHLRHARRRIEGESNFLSQRFDLPQEGRDAIAQFHVHCHLVGARFGERFE